MRIPDDELVKIKPFFVNYFNKLATDLNTLTAADISCMLGMVTVVSGKGELQAMLDSDSSIAWVREDGKNAGDIHIIFNVETSIALTGLMMMMSEGVINEQIKTKKLNQEILEGFQEVANQVTGSMNELLERKYKGGHLHLDRTHFYKFGEFPDTLQDKIRYLDVVLEIKVGKYPTHTARWLLTQGLAEAMLEFTFPTSDGVSATGSAAAGATGPIGVDLSGFADLGVDLDALGKIDLAKYANVGTDPNAARKVGGPADLDAFANLGVDASGLPRKGGPADLSAFAGEDDGRPIGYAQDNLPMPDEVGGIKIVMTEPPFSLDEEEKLIRAINAMRQDGYRYIGVDREGKLVRIITQSDLRQLMGPFFGTKAMTARDKAICTVPLSKINKEQTLIRIPLAGTIQQAADLLVEFELRALPVVSRNGVLRGFIPVHAVLNYFRKKKQG